jgi:hypothetical protein
MTWQEATEFALQVYGIGAVVSLGAAGVLHGAYLVLRRFSQK